MYLYCLNTIRTQVRPGLEQQLIRTLQQQKSNTIPNTNIHNNNNIVQSSIKPNIKSSNRKHDIQNRRTTSSSTGTITDCSSSNSKTSNNRGFSNKHSTTTATTITSATATATPSNNKNIKISTVSAQNQLQANKYSGYTNQEKKAPSAGTQFQK